MSASGLDSLARKAVAGEAPQLALEAAIAIAGGFASVSAGPVLHLRYISASGGEPPGIAVDLKAEDIGRLALDTADGLKRLIAAFDNDTTPYTAMRRARFNYDYDDYAHLARVDEWSSDEQGED